MLCRHKVTYLALPTDGISLDLKMPRSIFVLQNRSTIWNELTESNSEVFEYLKDTFSNLMSNPNFEEWIDCHAGFGNISATYYIMEELKNFIEMSK